MQKFNDNWALLSRINFLQRKIILNSILYYEYDMNSLPDNFYDDICRQLVDYQKQYSEIGNIFEDSEYGYVYYDFDGSTGYHLYGRLNEDDRKYLDLITVTYINNRRKRG